MNTPLTISILSLLALAPASLSSAPYHFLLESEWIEVEQTDLLDLTYGKKFDRPASELKKDILKLVQKKKARYVQRHIFTSKPGEQSRSDNTQQEIYPTDYTFFKYTPAVLKQDGTVLEAEKVSLPEPEAFEERPIGTIIKAEMAPVDGTNFTIALESTRNTRHLNTVRTVFNHKKTERKIEYPKFSKNTVKTQVTFNNQQTRLISSLPSFTKEGERDNSKRVLHFLKLTKVSTK